jgi:hypothetical protein
MTEQPSKGAVRFTRTETEPATVTTETLELLEERVKLLGADDDVTMLANFRVAATDDAATHPEFEISLLDTPAIRTAVDAMPLADLDGLQRVRAVLWPT